jgi:phosphohistidine phosphatase SixA
MLLLRHASAGERLDLPSLDCARPLDRVGRADALKLPDALAAYAIARIVSSTHKRCLDSVRPLAVSRGLDVESREQLAPDADIAATKALLDPLPDTALVCTHREVIERLFDGKIACEKGGAWVLERRRSRLAPVVYLPPATTQERERRLEALARR